MEEKKEIKVNAAVRAQVWKHWKPSFMKSKWSLLGTTIFFSVAMILDLLVKPIYWKHVFDGLVKHQDIWSYFYIALGVSVMAYVMSRFGDATMLLAETRIIRNLKGYILKGLLGKSMQFFTEHSSGGLVAKSKRFAAVSEQVIDEYVLSIFRSVILMVYLFIFTSIIIPDLTLVFVGWVAVFIFVVRKISRYRMKYDLISSNADSITTGYVSDTLLSVFTLRIFSAIPRQFKQFEEIISEEERKRRRSWYIGNVQWAVQSFLVLILEFTCMYYVLREIERGTYEVGMAALVQSYIASLAAYMWGMGRSLIKVRSAFADAFEMAELLDEPQAESVVDAPMPHIADRSVMLQNVSFGYTERQLILKNFSFAFESGRSYGIIGKTGSGKSTIVKLLQRFYEPNAGVISIGGQDIAGINKNALRKVIALVPQIPIFPSVTIREIIKLGRPDATEEEIVNAANLACCDFIWNKPDGLDTIIGERGIKLSGGEAQRLAIAAAVLQDAQIIIMDEPTSALDSATEYSIQRAIKNCFRGKTLIVIAHRLSTVAVLDEILHLENGMLAAHGTHDELLVISAAYNKMWDLQTNPQIVAHE